MDLNPADLLTQRVDQLKELPPGRYRRKWQCRCPAHDDKTPSMGIAEVDDGRILVHCFSGCSPLAIVESLGLELKDMFPYTENFKPLWKDRDMRKAVTTDDYFVAVVEGAIKNGERVSIEDRRKFLSAKKRIREAQK